MDVSTLKNHIINKQFDSYYIFAGSEWQVQRIYINQIAKVLDIGVVYIEQLKDVYNQLKNKGFVSKNYCYVVRDDRDLIVNEKLQSTINTVLGGNILIHLLTAVDKRTKFYKSNKDKIIEFKPLEPYILKKYIQKQIDLSDKNCDILMDICEYDYGRCLLEIDKIKLFDKWNTAPNITVNDCFKVLLEEGTIYEPPYDAIFDCVDAILKRQVNKSFDLLQQSYDSGESTMVLLTVLYDNARQLLQVQSCQSKDIARVTGLNGWQIKNAKERIGYYYNIELVELLKLIHKCEIGIKTGTIDEKYVMEYILVNLL